MRTGAHSRVPGRKLRLVRAAARRAAAMNSLRFAVALVSGSLCVGSASAADVFRCRGKLILPGDTMAHVLDTCGPPELQGVEHAIARARGLHGTSHVLGFASVEYWTYHRAPGQFRVRVRFAEGEVSTIELLDER
jgi:hypothetical protein